MAKMIKTVSLDRYHNDFTIPAWGWKENVYVDYKGKVRAMRFTKIDFKVTVAEDGYTHLRTPKPVYHVKMAGVGELSLDGDYVGRFPLRYLLNAEGFFDSIGVIDKEWIRLCNDDVKYVATEWMSQCFGVNRENLASLHLRHIHDGSAINLVRYVWDGVKPVPVPLTIPDEVCYTLKDGWHFAELCKLPKDSYATRAECFLASETKVVEFEDELQSVDEQLRKDIRQEVMRSFCNLFSASDIETLYVSIVDAIAEDVKECSDYPHYNGSDIRLALQNVVMHEMVGD